MTVCPSQVNLLILTHLPNSLLNALFDFVSPNFTPILSTFALGRQTYTCQERRAGQKLIGDSHHFQQALSGIS